MQIFIPGAGRKTDLVENFCLVAGVVLHLVDRASKGENENHQISMIAACSFFNVSHLTE